MVGFSFLLRELRASSSVLLVVTLVVLLLLLLFACLDRLLALRAELIGERVFGLHVELLAGVDAPPGVVLLSADWSLIARCCLLRNDLNQLNSTTNTIVLNIIQLDIRANNSNRDN